MKKSKALLGAGCFWGIEEFFRKISGVLDTKVGYSGGNSINPTYKDVCANKTGHAEVCRIEFNPKVITFNQILDIFWKIHDPTTLNQQGADIGTQYRSAIFYNSKEQLETAKKSKEKHMANFDKPI